MIPTTRFAPSPTGFLHLGHAYSALFAASRCPGRFLLRIEDIDAGRCRPEFAAALLEDLAWLGLRWEQPVRRQSEHMGDYQTALDRLKACGLVYPCFCTRKEILAEIAGMGSAPHGPDGPLSPGYGPDGPLYPGSCRRLSADEQRRRLEENRPFALRLDVERASALAGPLFWHDRGRGRVTATPRLFGDVVLARKDTPASYHLAVTVDDHLQGVTLVCRGEDLFSSTHIHRLLQALLGLDTPEYHHHPLITDPDGQRLSKRNHAPTLRALREKGETPEQVRASLGF